MTALILIVCILTAAPLHVLSEDAPLALHGKASWVRASLGSAYLAARMPKGTILRVCGPLACTVGAVSDRGPRRDIFPDRIVDLSRARFARVCGNPELLGTCDVTVTVLGRAPAPPPTDTE